MEITEVTKKDKHNDLKDNNLNKVRFVKFCSYPTVGGQLILEYVDSRIVGKVDEETLLGFDLDEKITRDFITLISNLTNLGTVLDLVAKAIVDEKHQDLNLLLGKRDLIFFILETKTVTKKDIGIIIQLKITKKTT